MRTTDLDSIKARHGIIGRDQRLYTALDTAVQVAHTDLSVLIQGESGVGKEVIPRVIHEHSPRKMKKYIAINCGSIPEGTIDSELFGHEKGAFTGAIGEHDGYFAAANGGTLFLDEVGELPLSTQARLLRVLETGEYIRVGSSEPRKTDVRIVAATNVNMQRAIREGKFREDLYFRLCTISIKLPPLRDRGQDVLLLFKKFCYDVAARYNIPQPLRLSTEAEQVMLTYKWPGNVRQLRNLAEQMSILCADQRIVTPAMLADYDIYPGSAGTDMAPLGGNRNDEQSGYDKERPIIFAMLNKLNQEIEELRAHLSAGSPITAPTTQLTAPTTQLTAPTTQLTAPGSDFAVPATPIAAPGSPILSSESPVITAPEVHHSEFADAEYEAELIEERNDLNLERMERKMIEEALRRNHYRRKNAASELGISERTLYRKISEYHIEEN